MNTLEKAHARIAPAALAAVLALLAGAAQARVTPPPLPAHSQLLRPEPGLSKPERERYVRAHHHKGHHKKDYTRDDSAAPPAKPASAARPPAPAPRPAPAPAPAKPTAGKN